MSFIAGAGLTNIDLLYTGVERIPDVGEEVYSKGFELRLGGGLPATLINLSRLGVPVKLATELGADMFSAFAKEEFKKNNVTPLNLYSGDEIPVNITSAIILENDRSFITYGKGGILPDDGAVERFYNFARGSKVTLMQPCGFLEAYKRLHDEGTILILDTGWDDELSIDKYREYLKIADYYTPNRKEALKITGTNTPDAALEVLGKFFKKPIIKLDKDGCIGVENGRQFFIKSLDTFKNVDSTGAGDAFLAGFAYGVFNDYEFEECILFGNITGGNCVTKAGALTASLTENELHEYARGVKNG
ncbi:MAG: carbohydrate kinase family protein [Eubacterium sp.]|nr:carbohydrate kinase family protein [Eubacterium sp.]